MKTITILFLIAAGCAVDPAERESTNDVQASGPNGDFQDCNPLTCGGAGGGGGTPSSCFTINCSNDLQCMIACSNATASCVLWENGGGTGGFCLDW